MLSMKKNQRLTAMVVMATLFVIAVTPRMAVAQTRPYAAAQVVEPFVEMQPGVYVATTWWNESYSNDYQFVWSPEVVMPQYNNETSGSSPAGGYHPADNSTWENWGNETWPWNNETWPWNNETWPWENSTDAYWDDWAKLTNGLMEPLIIYYVEDADGNAYWIEMNYTESWHTAWDFATLQVTVLLDPDGSYMSWLASQPNITDVWTVYWSPNPDALSGDEVVIVSDFYFMSTRTSGNYYINCTWYDMEMNLIENPEDIQLAEEYQWAGELTQEGRYDYNYTYVTYGYDVLEMYVDNNQTHQMEHYFTGLSVFNDTNNNGIMDIVYSDVDVDYDDDGVTDWKYQVVNESASERVYGFYTTGASLGDVVTPHINDDNQIEWSVEVTDIEGRLIDDREGQVALLPDIYYGPGLSMGEGMVDPEEDSGIDVSVESLAMVYRFGTTDDAAVLKIDQHVGDFTEPGTGAMLPELAGLGLTIDYWTSVASYDYRVGLTDGTEIPTDAEVDMSRTAPEGVLEVSDTGDDDLLSVIKFGGTYVWGRDGGTYDVGTAIIPGMIYEMGPVSLGGLEFAAGTMGQTDCWSAFYYCSCYSKWDGYSITHDPVFKVYPGVPPGQVSGRVSGIVYASVILGVVGIVAIALVAVRIRTTYRRG